MLHKYFSTEQFKNTIKAVNERANYHRVEVPTLTFLGTVKLHGTNSSVYSQLNIDSFVTQSKNNVITPELDNHGFSSFAHREKDKLESIFNEIKNNFPEAIEDKTAVIYGEWCGGSIQQNVALAQLDKRFVIFAIKLCDNNKSEDIPDVWLSRDEITSVIKNVGTHIYNIYDFPTWEINIDMSNPKAIQNKLINITNAVEEQCPVGYQFGVKGIGEGVVWKCITPHPVIKTDDLVFKVKGKEHSVSHVKTIAPVDVEKMNSINEFVEFVVTENRLQQGVDYLKEQHLEVDVKNMGVFLKWVSDDCFKEESDTLETSGLDKKEVGPAINQVSKKWFFNAIKQQETKKMKP